MADSAFRQEHDTMGVVNVPVNALYTAQTQRAVDNFPYGHPFTPRLITSMAQVKKACASANHELGLLDAEMTGAIHSAVDAIVGDYAQYQDQFPISIFQTGSGTSTNMNLNEVIATLASRCVCVSPAPVRVCHSPHTSAAVVHTERSRRACTRTTT